MIDKYLKYVVERYNLIIDRMISVKLKAKLVNLNVVQVYAPTIQSSDEKVEELQN